MTIDTERLKTDAAYWDECGAPEWATMFGLVGMRKLPVWFNLQEYQHASCGHSNRAFDFSNDGTYSLYQISGEIPRPQKPEVEWDVEGLPTDERHGEDLECALEFERSERESFVEELEDLERKVISLAESIQEKPSRQCSNRPISPENFPAPPIGAKLDYVVGSDRYPVTVVGHYDDEVVVFQHESAPDYVGVQPGYLKTRRTKEQREREELARTIHEAPLDMNGHATMVDVDSVADAIIAAGWKKDA